MSDDSKRKGYLQDASQVLQSLLQNSKSPLSQPFTRWKLWQHWDKVVGESLAKICTPVGYQKGKLYIWVENSAYLQELQFMAKPLIKQVNEYLGKQWVSSIKLTLDRKSVPRSAEMQEEMRDFLSKSLGL